AVEEQFYLVWPLLLTAGLVVLPRRALAVVVLMGAAASTMEMMLLYQRGASISRLYYGTDTRAAGLLIGAGLALVPGLWAGDVEGAAGRMVRGACGWFCLMLFAAVCLSIDDSGAFLYNGGFAVVSLAGAGLIIGAVHPAALLSKVLERAPLRWLGRRSYGIYLWHWPIFVLMQPSLGIPGGAAIVIAAQIATAVVVAALSYRYVEQPIRHGALSRAALSLRGHFGRRRLTAAWAVGASGGLVAFLAVWIVRIPSPALPSYFALTHVEITSAAATAMPTAPGLVRGPTPAIPAFGPTHVATAVPAVHGPVLLVASPTAVATAASQSESSSASSASLVYAPTAAPARPLPPASSARVTAIGDSVMLGAAQQLAAVTPGIYVDAAVGRQVSAAIALLRQLQANGELGGVVLIDMGNNGTFTETQFNEIMGIAGPGRRVVFVNLKEPRSWEASNNDVITRGVARYPNAVLVDWRAASISRPELFW
ncbi:MAG: acyltransferase family protein, partial [Gemmatimonadaceae bacterium]